jgi:hypothetical protein
LINREKEKEVVAALFVANAYSFGFVDVDVATNGFAFP